MIRLGHIAGKGELTLADVVLFDDNTGVVHWREPHVVRPTVATPEQLEQQYRFPSCHLVWDSPAT